MKELEEAAWKAAATANLLRARKKHGRAGKKSHSGCLVCKHRRIKCDETRPQCHRCSTTARKCEYAEKVELSATSSAASPTSSQLSHVSSIERVLSPWNLKQGDERTFDYFISWTAPRLGGSSLDKPFWCGPVLALAQSEPVVLDALLAISILYEHPQFMKTFLTNNEHYPTPRDHPGISSVKHVDKQHASALRYYNRSMKTLRHQVANNRASPLLALVSCMLFTCIEVIRDSAFSALALITHGTRLLDQIGSCPLALDNALLKPTRQILIRMSLTAAAFGHWLPIEITPHCTIVGASTIFPSMEDARDALFALNQDGHRFLQDAARSWNEFTSGYLDDDKDVEDPHKSLATTTLPVQSNYDTLRYGCSAEASVTEIKGQEDIIFSMYQIAMSDNLAHFFPSVLRHVGDDLERRIREWYDVFERSELANDEDEAACSLQMLYHVSLVSVAIRMSPMQTAYDEYTYHFREIIRLASLYNSKKSLKGATFTLEVGALAPLWFVVLKCRIPSLRRQALFLLSTGVKKESVFGARPMSEIAVRIIAFEEEGLGLSLPSLEACSTPLEAFDDRMPSEEQRIQNMEILINKKVERFEIRLTRYVRGAEGNLVKDATDVPL